MHSSIDRTTLRAVPDGSQMEATIDRQTVGKEEAVVMRFWYAGRQMLRGPRVVLPG